MYCWRALSRASISLMLKLPSLMSESSGSWSPLGFKPYLLWRSKSDSSSVVTISGSGVEDRFLPPRARLEDFVLILKILSHYDVIMVRLPGMFGALCQVRCWPMPATWMSTFCLFFFEFFRPNIGCWVKAATWSAWCSWTTGRARPIWSNWRCDGSDGTTWWRISTSHLTCSKTFFYHMIQNKKVPWRWSWSSICWRSFCSFSGGISGITPTQGRNSWLQFGW